MCFSQRAQFTWNVILANHSSNVGAWEGGRENMVKEGEEVSSSLPPQSEYGYGVGNRAKEMKLFAACVFLKIWVYLMHAE